MYMCCCFPRYIGEFTCAMRKSTTHGAHIEFESHEANIGIGVGRLQDTYFVTKSKIEQSWAHYIKLSLKSRPQPSGLCWIEGTDIAIIRHLFWLPLFGETAHRLIKQRRAAILSHWWTKRSDYRAGKFEACPLLPKDFTSKKELLMPQKFTDGKTQLERSWSGSLTITDSELTFEIRIRNSITTECPQKTHQ